MKLSKYRWLGMYLLLCAAILAFVITSYQGLSMLSKKSHDLVNLKLQNRTASDQLSSLAAAKKQLEKYSYFNDVAKTVIPNDKDQAQAVLDIFQNAGKAGIALQDVTFPASNLGGGTTSVSASSAGAAGAASAAPPLTQAKPVSGISGLYSLQLTVAPQSGGQVPPAQQTTYDKFLNFLSLIEHDRRTAQITQISIEPQSNSPYMSFSLTLNVFIKP